MMRCTICKQGTTREGQTTVTLNREHTTVIFKGVPAEICDNCGEYYLDEDTTRRVMEMARQAAANGAELEIVRYAA